VLHCISALYHYRNTADWTRWRHKITAQTQRGPAPRSCIGPRAQVLHWAPRPGLALVPASARAGPAPRKILVLYCSWRSEKRPEMELNAILHFWQHPAKIFALQTPTIWLAPVCHGLEISDRSVPAHHPSFPSASIPPRWQYRHKGCPR